MPFFVIVIVAIIGIFKLLLKSTVLLLISDLILSPWEVSAVPLCLVVLKAEGQQQLHPGCGERHKQTPSAF